jgi:hypothetical protein
MWCSWQRLAGAPQPMQPPSRAISAMRCARVVRCQAHHIHHWADGGLTNLSNLCLLCWGCHHRIHHYGWQVRYDVYRVPAPATGRRLPGG